jgi:N-acetylglucosaminyl-diphospho-decaprenol L-rhamnosyltransferase
MITASIVSHGHGRMVAHLTEDLLECPEISLIVVTQNVAEDTDYPVTDRVKVRRAARPRGYGANQNAAFAGVITPFLCVLNPDIRLQGNPFRQLLSAMQDERVAACAPVITTPEGLREDSARKFPTAASLLGKALGFGDGTYSSTVEAQNPDWLAGMFLLLRVSCFREVAGFDEKYFLYYEDVDLGWRLRHRGYELRQVQQAMAIHDARRASRRDWRHARWHLSSMARFLARSARG